MANETVEFDNILNYRAGDTSGVKAAEKLKKELDANTKASAAAKQSAASFSAELAKIDRNNQIKKLVSEQAKYANETGNSKTAVVQLTAELEKLNATQNEVVAAAAQFRSEQEKIANLKTPEVKLKDDRAGDISTGLGSLASVAGAGGQNPLAEALALGGDVTGAVEYFKVLKTNVVDVGRAAAEGGGLVGSLASAASALVPGLTGAAAGFAGLALAAAPFVAIAAAVVIGVTAINNAYQESYKSGEQYAQTILAGVDAQVQAERALKEGNTGALEDLYQNAIDTMQSAADRANKIKQDLDAAIAARDANPTAENQGAVDTFQKSLGEAITTMTEAQTAYSNVAAVWSSSAAAQLRVAQAQEASFAKQLDAQRQVNDLLAGGLGVDALNEKIHATQAALDEELVLRDAIANQLGTSNALYTDAQARIDQYNLTLATLGQSQTFVAAAANDAANAEKVRADSAVKSAAALQALNEQTNSLIANAQAAAAALKASRDLTDTRAAEDATRQQVREDADLKAQLEAQAQNHADKLISIEADGAAKIADLRQQLTAKIAETASAIASEQAKAQAEQIKAQTAFDKSQARQLRDFERDKQRIIEDAGEAQKDALLSNDVTALLRGQAETAKRLSRGQEDFNTKRSDQAVDFGEESAARQAAAQERINQLNAELDQFKIASAAKIAEEQASIQARLAAEQAGYDAQLAQDQARRDTLQAREDEDAAIRQARLEEDRGIQGAAAQAALDKSLAEIDAKRAKELEANGQALDGYTKLQTAATLFNQTVSQTLLSLQNAANTAINPIAGAAKGQVPVRPFAEGGIVKAGGSPILGLFERKRDEAVIPLPAGGMMGGGQQLVMNAPVTINGEVNADNIGQIVNEITNAIVYAGNRLVSGVLQNTR